MVKAWQCARFNVASMIARANITYYREKYHDRYICVYILYADIHPNLLWYFLVFRRILKPTANCFSLGKSKNETRVIHPTMFYIREIRRTFLWIKSIILYIYYTYVHVFYILFQGIWIPILTCDSCIPPRFKNHYYITYLFW